MIRRESPLPLAIILVLMVLASCEDQEPPVTANDAMTHRYLCTGGPESTYWECICIDCTEPTTPMTSDPHDINTL